MRPQRGEEGTWSRVNENVKQQEPILRPPDGSCRTGTFGSEWNGSCRTVGHSVLKKIHRGLLGFQSQEGPVLDPGWASLHASGIPEGGEAFPAPGSSSDLNYSRQGLLKALPTTRSPVPGVCLSHTLRRQLLPPTDLVVTGMTLNTPVSSHCPVLGIYLRASQVSSTFTESPSADTVSFAPPWLGVEAACLLRGVHYYKETLYPGSQGAANGRIPSTIF